MRILIIGGTVFVGRWCAMEALRRGHSVCLLHRGRRGSGLVPGTEEILADRDGGLGALQGQSWDAVVDTCGYVPRIVRQSVKTLKRSVWRYLFVSTISVYQEPLASGADEGAPTIELADPATEIVNGETYGGLKVLCEREVVEGFGEQSLIVRPGLLAGPNDPTNRFTYWVERIARSGQMLAPAVAESPLQLLDVRDLATFMILALEQDLGQTYNAAGPPTTFGEMIATCLRLNPSVQILWGEDAFLREHHVRLWQDLPLALPHDEAANGLMQVSSNRALAKGLPYRSLFETAVDTLAWRQTNPGGDYSHGLKPEVEQAVIEAWVGG